MGYGGLGPELLANETLMREGQVIRSTSNQVYIHYRSLQQTNHGVFSLHYQGTAMPPPPDLMFIFVGITFQYLREGLQGAVLTVRGPCSSCFDVYSLPAVLPVPAVPREWRSDGDRHPPGRSGALSL